MPFTVAATDAGGTVTAGEVLRSADAPAVLALIQAHPEWRHLIADLTNIDRRRPRERDDELQSIHDFIRTVRLLDLPSGFRIAVVAEPPIADLAADFVDMTRFLLDDVETGLFQSVLAARAWVEPDA